MLKNKRVVKALTIGLATVLATPSMTAFAAAPGEVEPQAADDTVAAVAVDASAVTEVAPVEVKSDNRDEIDTAIKETKEALEAEKKANDAADDAVKNGLPQAGVVSLLEDNDVNVVTGARFEGWNLVLKTEDVDDSASENDQLVDDALSDAAKALDDGKEELEDKLEEFNDKAKESLGDSKEAVTDAYRAAGELLKVDDAKKAADTATNSGAAQAQADVAKEASENAAAFANKAETNASDAYDEFLAAKKNYEDAESIAKAANEAADKAIKEGRADAEEAVTYAKAAEFTAIGLKNEMEAAKKVAEGTQAYYEGELKKVEDNLKALGDAKVQLDKDHEYAQGQYNKEKALLDEMAGALKDAQDAYNGTISDWDVIAETWKIQGLEGALARARAALAKAGYDQWQADKKVEQLELSQELKDAYGLIEKAYAQALEEANKNAEEGKKVGLEEVVSDNVTVISGKISDLKDAYGENIGDIQKTLLSSTASDDEKEAAVVSLIDNISKASGAEKYETEDYEGKKYSLYKVKDGENFKFYTCEVVDGKIVVAEVTEQIHEITYDKIAKLIDIDDTNTNLTKEQLDELINAGLETGTFYYDSETQTVSTDKVSGYNVSYTETIKRKSNTNYDVVGQKGTVSLKFQYTDGWYTYEDVFKFNVEYTQGIDDEAWTFTTYDDNTHYYLTYQNLLIFFNQYYGPYGYSVRKINGANSTADVLKAINLIVNQKVENVSANKLNKYKNKDNYSATPIYEEKEVTVYNLVKNVTSKTGTDKDALIAEVEALGRTVLHIDTMEVTENVETPTQVIDTENPNYLMWTVGPGRDAYENGKLKYAYKVYSTMGKEYSYDPKAEDDDNTLKWDARIKRWKVKINGEWTNIYLAPYFGTQNEYNHRIEEYSKQTTATVSVPTKVTKYIAYYQDSTEVDDLDKPHVSYEYAVNQGATIDNLADLNDNLDTVKGYLKKVQEYNKAQADYDAAVKAAKEAKDKYDAAKAEKDRLKGEVKKAKDNLDAAIKDKAEKYWALERAKAAYNWQSYKTDGAEAALKDIEWKLRTNAWFTRLNEIAKTQLEKDIDDAKKSVTAWTKKAEIAKELADKATKARVEAEEARDAYNKIGKSNLGDAALAQAKARLDQAEAAALVAKTAAEQARKDADEAASEYQQILTRVQALIDAENAAAGAGAGEGEGAGAGAGETTTGGAVVLATIPTGEEVPGAPAAPVAGGAGVAANAAPAAAEATTVDIAPQNSALAATVPEDNKSDDGLATILPQGPALAADIADTEHLTWWWLLVVAVLGGTGYAMYKKFQTKKEEKVTK